MCCNKIAIPEKKNLRDAVRLAVSGGAFRLVSGPPYEVDTGAAESVEVTVNVYSSLSMRIMVPGQRGE